MSRATFIRHFTRGTGMSIGVFLTKVRMMIAAELLTDTDPVDRIDRGHGRLSFRILIRTRLPPCHGNDSSPIPTRGFPAT